MTTLPPTPAGGSARRGLLTAGVLTVGALALSACTPSQADPGAAATPSASAAAFPMTITDCGEEVTVDAAPQSVMTIGSDAISLLDAAGATGLITARSGEFGADLPEGLTEPPTDAPVVDPSDPTTEQIVGSGADVVIGYGFFSADPTALADAGIATLTVSGECGHDGGGAVEPVSFDAVVADVERFGALFGTSETAAASVADLRERIAQVEAGRPASERTAATVYYFSSSSPLSAYGGTGIIQSMMAGAGLENVYGDQPKTYLEISLESLLDADPEVIVLAYGLHGDSLDEATARFLAEPGVADLQAVRAGRILGVPANETTATPAAVAGIERLQQGVAELSS